MVKKKNAEVGSDSEFLIDLVKKVNKGAGSEVMFLVEDGGTDVKNWVKSGSTLLDYCMSNRRNGGYPISKIVEITGHSATGKSLLAIAAAANAQKDGGLGIMLDYEGSFGTEFAKVIGLDVENNFVYSQPNSLEDGFSMIFETLRSLSEAEKAGREPYKSVVIIFDSIAGAPLAQDLVSENVSPTDSIGLKARIISKNITTLRAAAGRKNVILIFLNQLKANIGAMGHGEKFVSPGGKAIPYFSSIRLQVNAIAKLKVKDEVVGIKTLVDVKKSRFGPPHRKCEFDLFFNRGIDDAGSILDYLSEARGIVKTSGGSKGSLYHFKGDDRDSTALNKKDWSKQFKTNETFRSRVEDLLEIAMVRKPELEEDEAVTSESGAEDD